MIKEIIVVEGKDDITAIKQAIDAEVVATNGYRITKETIEFLKQASKRREIVLFTDPDFAGKQIRMTLEKRLGVPVKHAFLPQKKALKKDNIGIENAKPEDIIEALKRARCKVEDIKEEYTMQDMIENGLSALNQSKERREKLGELLGIGYGNAKQILGRLNSFAITREEFNEAMEKISNGTR